MLKKGAFFRKLEKLNVLEKYLKQLDEFWGLESNDRLNKILETASSYRDVLYYSFLLNERWRIIANKIDLIRINRIHKIKIKIK